MMQPGSPISKQAILDDIRKLDTEIEIEKHSFYSLKTGGKGGGNLTRKPSERSFKKYGDAGPPSGGKG